MRKSWWKRTDYFLIFLVIVLTAFGMVLIYSATRDDTTGDAGRTTRQLNYFVVGFFCMLIIMRINYEFLARMEWYLYFFNLIMLIVVLFAGHEALGAQRWIALGSFTVQPSEFAKMLMIICLATRLSREDALETDKLLGTFFYLAIPMLLIMKQPDLGTALVLIAILFSMLFIRGISPYFLLLLIILGFSVSPFILKEYQKERLLVFLNPQKDPTGSGWNIIQSTVGIGSGQLLGKGLFSGTQTQLKFIPEHSTDFIFAVLGEELGFLGCIALIILYFFLLWRIIRIAMASKDNLGTLIAVGIASMFFFHIFVNVGMTIGVMPVTGIPLPFFSYGGSALITNMICIGLLINIAGKQESIFKETLIRKSKI